MKINELINNFEIAISNEEREILDSLNEDRLLTSFTDREKYVLENLIRKSLVQRFKKNNLIMVRKNG